MTHSFVIVHREPDGSFSPLAVIDSNDCSIACALGGYSIEEGPTEFALINDHPPQPRFNPWRDVATRIEDL